MYTCPFWSTTKKKSCLRFILPVFPRWTTTSGRQNTIECSINKGKGSGYLEKLYVTPQLRKWNKTAFQMRKYFEHRLWRHYWFIHKRKVRKLGYDKYSLSRISDWTYSGAELSMNLCIVPLSTIRQNQIKGQHISPRTLCNRRFLLYTIYGGTSALTPISERGLPCSMFYWETLKKKDGKPGRTS